MKSILLILLALNTHSLFAQFQYRIDLTASESENKSYLSDIGKHIPNTYKRSVSDNLILFSTPVNYTTQVIDSILHLVGISSGTTVKTKGYHPMMEKVGGTNCEQAQQLCSNSSLPGNSSGHGTQELNNSNHGCLEDNENQSSWYYLNIQTAGTLSMRINPASSDDYDFAVWGPFTAANAGVNCPPVSTPTRCSWAAAGGNYNTGLGNGAADFSEDADGNRWVAPLNVSAGQVYILLVDNYSVSSNGYNIDFSWNASNQSTATLGCIPVVLPVELSSFEGTYSSGINLLRWTTETEKDNDYFQVEWTTDPANDKWEKMDVVDGAGNSETRLDYSLNLYTYTRNVINYYRIKQVDLDGQVRTYPTLALIDNRTKEQKLVKVVNLLGQEVSESEKGLVIYVYDDGTVEKRIN
jgi:hypothetical protein